MTPFESIEKRNIMFDFLSKNLVTIGALTGNPGQDEYTSSLCTNEDIAYGPEEDAPVIGFNYNGSSLSKDYAFRICYWMAAMAGPSKYVAQVNKELKYIIYDGDEPWYLVDKGVRLGEEASIEVDNIGFRPISHRAHSLFFRKDTVKKFNQKIEAELQRLTKIWGMQG